MTHSPLVPRGLLDDDGLTSRDVRLACAAGTLEKIRYGVYAPPAELDDRARHLRLVAATLPLVHPDSVLSHDSAAALHGLPLTSSRLARVQVTRNGGGHGRFGPHLILRTSPLGPGDVVVVDGRAVTSLERTAADLARVLSHEWGVITCDAALRAGADHEALLWQLDRDRGRRGNTRARRAVLFADARAESPLESLSRVQIRRAGLPAPELQFVVRRNGRVVAVTDFAWPSLRTVGEADGRVKYDDLVPVGQTAADVVMREKAREREIRSEGFWVVRWGWQEASRPGALARLLREAFALAPRGT